MKNGFAGAEIQKSPCRLLTRNGKQNWNRVRAFLPCVLRVSMRAVYRT